MNMLRGSPQEWKKKTVLITELKGPSGFRLQYERHSKQAGFVPDASSDSHGLLIQPTLPIGVRLRHVPDGTRVEVWIDQRKAPCPVPAEQAGRVRNASGTEQVGGPLKTGANTSATYSLSTSAFTHCTRTPCRSLCHLAGRTLVRPRRISLARTTPSMARPLRSRPARHRV